MQIRGQSTHACDFLLPGTYTAGFGRKWRLMCLSLLTYQFRKERGSFVLNFCPPSAVRMVIKMPFHSTTREGGNRILRIGGRMEQKCMLTPWPTHEVLLGPVFQTVSIVRRASFLPGTYKVYRL